MTWAPRCWCGSATLVPFSPTYLRCAACETLVSTHEPETDLTLVKDHPRQLYSREYWFEHQESDLHQPNIVDRAKNDLPERGLHWLRATLRYCPPPGRLLELGAAHGGFVALLRQSGYDATGLELSPWVAQFARDTFGVPMLVGALEDQGLTPAAFDGVLLMDVLEHLTDPTATMRRAVELLGSDGILVMQTPRYIEGKTYQAMLTEADPFLDQLKTNEHLYLFSHNSIRRFLGELGVHELAFEPAIFAHYDMFVVASRAALHVSTEPEIETALQASPGGRLVSAMLDLQRQLAISEADRAARLAVINEQQDAIAAFRMADDRQPGATPPGVHLDGDVQTYQAALLEQLQAKQTVIEKLGSLVQELDLAAKARLEVAHELGKQLSVMRQDAEINARVERLEQVLSHQDRVLESLTDYADQLRLSPMVQLPGPPPGAALPGFDANAVVAGSAVDGSANNQSVPAVLGRLERHIESLIQKRDQAEEAAVASELRALRRERQSADAIASAREAIIQEQRRTIEDLRGRRWGGRLRTFFDPRIGVLHHYDARTLVVPPSYHALRPLASPPSISIVTATLNQGGFLKRTLDSVLDQKYPRLEYVVQDGASTDETVDILKTYAAQLAHVDSHPDNGFAEAIDSGFRLTSGEIMAWLNSDDLLLPGALNYVASYFADHPDVDVVYGHRVLIDEYDGEIGRWVLPKHDDTILSWVDYVPQETLFWRRSLWERVGGSLDENLHFAIDWDLLLRFRDAGARMRRLPRFLGAFRVHANQKTSSEMGSVGINEMEQLRRRALGRSVTKGEITRAVAPYLRRHFVLHKLYRAGLVRY